MVPGNGDYTSPTFLYPEHHPSSVGLGDGCQTGGPGSRTQHALHLGRLTRANGTDTGSDDVVVGDVEEQQREHMKRMLSQINDRKERKARNTVVGVQRSLAEIDASIAASRSACKDTLRASRAEAKARYAEAIAAALVAFNDASVEITNRRAKSLQGVFRNADLMAQAQGFDSFEALKVYLGQHDAVSRAPRDSGNEQQGSHGSYTETDDHRTERTLHFMRTFPNSYSFCFTTPLHISKPTTPAVLPAVSPGSIIVVPEAVAHQSTASPVALWMLRKGGRFFAGPGGALALTYFTPTILGVPMILEVLFLAPVWEEVIKVLCGYLFQTATPGAMFGYLEFLMYVLPSISNPATFSFRCFTRYPALKMHMASDTHGSGITSLPKRIRDHLAFNFRATCTHIAGSLASFLLIDAFTAGTLASANRTGRWQVVENRGSSRRGDAIDLDNPQPLTPPDESKSDPSSEDDDESQTPADIKALAKMVKIQTLTTELRRVTEEEGYHYEDRGYRSRQRTRNVQERNLEEKALAGHGTKVYRMYLTTIDAVRLYTQQHKMIVPWACDEEAQLASQLGYLCWEEVVESSNQVSWIREKIRCMPESRNLLNAAEYWARTLNIKGRTASRLAVQRHRIDLLRDAHAGVSMSGVTVGVLNAPAHPSLPLAGSSNVLLTQCTVAFLCLLNGFAGWDSGRNTLAGQGKSMFSSAQTRLGYILPAIGRYLGVVCGILRW